MDFQESRLKELKDMSSSTSLKEIADIVNLANIIYKVDEKSQKDLFQIIRTKMPEFMKYVFTKILKHQKTWDDRVKAILDVASYVFNQPSFSNTKSSGKVLNKSEKQNLTSINRAQEGFKNPFFHDIKIGAKTHSALIDTGADATIINVRNIPKDTPIYKTSTSLVAANGKRIETIGQAKDIPATILKEEITISPKVVENHPTFTIIGVDTIKKHPQLLKKATSLLNSPQLTRLCSHTNYAYSLQNTVSNSLSQEVKRRYSDIFASNLTHSTLCAIKKHAIDTGDHKPICQQNGRSLVHLEPQVNEEIQRLLKSGIIRHSQSAWRSRIVVVPKPNGKIRMCIDYRALNEITTKNAYPLPRIDEILDALSEAKVFSIVDATSGYHQIAMNEEDIKKTAFSWKGQLYEYTRMPFGLCNAPATFQAVMDIVLAEDCWKHAIPYLDDIIIYSKTLEEHKKHLESVLGKIRAAGLTLNNEKSLFFSKRSKILRISHSRWKSTTGSQEN